MSVHLFTKVNSKELYYDILPLEVINTMSQPFYVRKIRDLCEDHYLTQQQIADYLGTSQTMYARYERGANELPIRHLISLCNLYHVSSDFILGINNKKNKYLIF